MNNVIELRPRVNRLRKELEESLRSFLEGLEVTDPTAFFAGDFDALAGRAQKEHQPEDYYKGFNNRVELDGFGGTLTEQH